MATTSSLGGLGARINLLGRAHLKPRFHGFLNGFLGQFSADGRSLRVGDGYERPTVRVRPRRWAP
jgi:hypothetical protein